MLVSVAVFAACLLAVASGKPVQDSGDKFVGGYILMSRARNGRVIGVDELATLADNANTLPLTRLWIGFFDPTLVYIPNSNTLQYAGLNASSDPDFGFASIKASIGKLKDAGIQVLLSMGGWNYNCFPYLYARYSVGGYGTETPNYWKIQQYGNGSIDNCVPSNQFCYVCEPPSENTTLDSFAIFPEPSFSPTWQQAISYVEAHQNSTNPPQWDVLTAGQTWTDPKTGISVVVPGRTLYQKYQRDPYADIVYLARDLGADGIDLDYEEFWHADYFKIGAGPWVLPQTMYKYAAIAMDLMINIKMIAPNLRLSTASGAVSGWSTNWWGGNLKGLMYGLRQLMPDIVNFMATGANSGGINVMTYDLSDNPEFHECPQDNVCALDQQVQFYMKTYLDSDILANVGYEIGTPAYPSPDHDKQHQLPLTREMLNSIISTVQPQVNGGFIWELFKTSDSTDNVTPTQALQAICTTVLPGNARCTGSIPDV